MTTTVFTVEADDDGLWWTLQQLTAASPLDSGFIEQCVALGLVELGGLPSQWRFSPLVRLRLERAWRLHRDLELHPSALPLVLELLEEVELLRQESAQLRQRLRHWEVGHG